MEESIQENTKFLQDEGKKERFIIKTPIMSEIFDHFSVQDKFPPFTYMYIIS